jgi:Otopetrin
VIAKFGLMHMIATNLCEWLYVLIEETKSDIYHISAKNSLHPQQHDSSSSIESSAGGCACSFHYFPGGAHSTFFIGRGERKLAF